jgi:agmatine/peptidylarginine deiminase
LTVISAFLVLGMPPGQVAAQDRTGDEWKRAHGPYQPGEYSTLPQEMTPEERLEWDRGRPTPTPSEAPAPPVRNVAEFEPMQGVLIRYPLGISYAVVREMAKDALVYTIVSSETVKTQATNNFTNNGVNMANVRFIMSPTDSIYTRDYGPWGVFDGADSFGVIDFTYNRPRPNDDAITGKVAEYLGEPMYTMDLIYGGGNYMTDGMGISVSTDLVVSENPAKSMDEIKQTAKDFLGVHTFHIVPDTTGTYIRHVDTWAKFLAVDKILIRQVPPSHPRYAETEAAVDYFASQISSYGTPYRIFRVQTPNNEPYTNSLILNDKVLVPIVNGAWDDDAIAAYQAAMPGYQVLGFTGSWLSTDALHCRAMGIPDTGMLYIQHRPPLGAQPSGQPIEVRATVIPHSGEALEGGSPAIRWRASPAGPYAEVPMVPVGTNEYRGFIPAQTAAGNVHYYIEAGDQSGRIEMHPFIGGLDPHVVVVGTGGGGAPAAPSNLVATLVSATTVNLSWTDNSGNESGFKIERRVGPRGNFVQIATVGANVKTYSDTGVTGGQAHSYRVRATNASGNSAYSNIANVLP